MSLQDICKYKASFAPYDGDSFDFLYTSLSILINGFLTVDGSSIHMVAFSVVALAVGMVEVVTHQGARVLIKI